MPELDATRGLAILGVIIYHGLFWNADLSPFHGWRLALLTAAWAGRMGVNLFFVLSGFLISGILLDSKLRPDYYRRFYSRRAKRILPAYLAIISVLAVLGYPPKFLLLSVAFLSNVTPLFGVAIAYPVFWSLAVEEHFYLAWPIIVRKSSMRVLGILSAAIICVSPLMRAASLQYTHSFRFNDYTWNSLDGLACGALLAVIVRMIGEDRRNLLLIVCLFAVAGLILLPFTLSSRHFVAGAAMQVVPFHFIFIAWLGASLLIGTSAYKRFVDSPILGFFGYISYGLYLIHMLVFRAYDAVVPENSPSMIGGMMLRLIVVGTVATGLAWLSRRYFESLFMADRRLSLDLEAQADL